MIPEEVVALVVVEVLRTLSRSAIPFVAEKIAQSKTWYLVVPRARVAVRARNSPERGDAEFDLGWTEEGWDASHATAV